jgi:Tfp pilus assembly protein PilF
MRHFERGQRIGFLFTPGALRYQASFYLAKGDTADAEASVRKLLDIVPDEPESHRWLAAIFRLQDKPIEAEQEYRRALKLDRAHDAARSDLATLLVSQKRWDDAVRVLQEGASASPPSPRWQLQSAGVISQRGVERLQQGTRDAGMQDLRDALAINPDLTQTRYNLALALLSIPVVPEAIEHLQRVVREKPEMAEAHYNLAVAIFMSGRPAEAIPEAREALRLAPDDQQAQQFLQMLLKNGAGG